MKSEVATIDATPSKRLFRSIIADYGLVTAISELVDNVVDSRSRSGNKSTATKVQISIDLDDQSIIILDNAGGIAQEDLPKLITPGASMSDGQGSSIGIFGVGSKRAAVALAKDIKIASRHGRDKETFLVEYDDSWLSSDDWQLPYYKTDQIAPSSTQITFSRLRTSINSEDVSTIERRLSETFAKFIKSGELIIQVGEKTLPATEFDKWAYPPGYEPRSFVRNFVPAERRLPINLTITSGLTLNRGSTAPNYGVYIYCNRRLICRASRESELGFHAGIAGVAHPSMANSQVIVEISGSALDMPWNSSKTGINFNHSIFKAIRPDIHTAVKNSTTLSRRFWPSFDESLAPYTAGNIIVERLQPESRLLPSKLPPIPPTKRKKATSITNANKEVSATKPWVVGAYESIAVVELLKGKKALQQRNRIILIILDSTLEIAFKDFLAHDVPQPLGDAKLQALFSNRLDVQREIEKTVLTGDPVWRQLAYFYKQRCELIHKRVSVSVSDEEVQNFQAAVEKLLSKMFGLKFPRA